MDAELCVNAVEVVFLLLPGVDLISDLLVVFTTKNLIKLFTTWPPADWPTWLFLGGLVVFIFSQWTRLCIDASCFPRFQSRNFCKLLIFGGLPGALVVLERIVRLPLVVLDPLLGLGYCSRHRRCESLVRDRMRLLTRDECPYYDARPWPMKYFHMISSILSGGRWRALHWEWIAANPTPTQAKAANERVAHFIIRLVIFEEATENLGGLAMSIAAIVLKEREEGEIDVRDARTILAFASIAISLVSVTYETGRFVGTLDTLSGRALPTRCINVSSSHSATSRGSSFTPY